MPYASQTDLCPQRVTPTQLLQLTTDAGATVPDPAVIAGVLTDASAVVDSYCGQRYAVPLQQSQMALHMTADIAVFLLFQRRGQVKPGTARQAAYDDAMARLKAIAAGTESLDIPANALPQTSSGDVLVTQVPQVFTRTPGAPFGCCDDEGFWL